MLEGRRILVLQSEVLVAIDLQVLLEDEGAVVSVGPRCHLEEDFDCLIVDSAATNQLIANDFAASGIPLVGYTGDTDAVSQRYPDAVVVKKPALPAELLAAVRGALCSDAPDGGRRLWKDQLIWVRDRPGGEQVEIRGSVTECTRGWVVARPSMWRPERGKRREKGSPDAFP